MSDKKLRVFKLRNGSDEDLLKGLEEYKKELNTLRTMKITGGGTSAKLGKIRVVRKAIAKYLTVINQRNREKVREQFKGKKYYPTDLRSKKTRAIRRELNKHQRKLRTLRTIKKADNFPLRKYALRA